MVVPFHHLGAHVDPGQPLPAGVAFPVVHDTVCGPKEEDRVVRAPAPTVPAAADAESPPSIASPYVIRLAVTDEILHWCLVADVKSPGPMQVL